MKWEEIQKTLEEERAEARSQLAEALRERNEAREAARAMYEMLYRGGEFYDEMTKKHPWLEEE